LTIVFPDEDKRFAAVGTGGKFLMYGSGKAIYKSAFPGTTAMTGTFRPTIDGTSDNCTARGDIFIASQENDPVYWNGYDASWSLVSARVRNDGTAGTDPMRAEGICYHNDRLHHFRGNLRTIATDTIAAGDTIADAEFTDLSAAWTTSPYFTNYWAGYRFYPNTTDYPYTWFLVTASTATKLTMSMPSGGKLGDYTASGKTYNLVKEYPKASWYCSVDINGDVDPADWPTTQYITWGDEDGDSLMRLISWDGQLVAICRSGIYTVTGYGPSTPWDKSFIQRGYGTSSPRSVVNAGDALYWWSERGIVKWSGGMPEIISDSMSSVVYDDVNWDAKSHIEGHYHAGLLYWSYPSKGVQNGSGVTSNINDMLLVFNPDNGKTVLRDFGVYNMHTWIGEKDGDELYAWEPKSGAVIQLAPVSTYDASGLDQTLVIETPLIPTDGDNILAESQWLYLMAHIDSDQDIAVADQHVYYKTDANDTWTAAGDMVPVTSATTGRTSINTTDRTYICRLPYGTKSANIAVKITATTQSAFVIRHLELRADMVESQAIE
jgi:hypothetical protein